jgi:predicted nucleotidyltransferase
MDVPADNSVADLTAALVLLVSRSIPGVQAVYLFGSAAEGRLRADSDMDLAVLAAAPIAPELRFDTAEACARQLGREVDLVDLRTAPLVLQAQIVGRGRRLAGLGASREAAFFENQVLSRYCAFAEERGPLMEEVVRRRSIHAA